MSIDIGKSAKKVDVDNRISLRYYYRIADSLIRQANIYRNERNIIDLYVMLLRFSSLITETIPRHRDYRLSPQSERSHFKLKLLSALAELETLQPDVKRRLAELNPKPASFSNGWAQSQQNVSSSPYEWPPIKNPAPLYQPHVQGNRIGANGYAQKTDQLPLVRRSSFNIPPPREETLMKHSILGRDGLHGQWQPPIVHQPIQYPTSNLDLTPIDIASLLNPGEEEKRTDTKKDEAAPEHKKTPLEEVLSLQEDIKPSQVDTTLESLVKLEISKDPSKDPMPPPVLAEVLDLPGPTPLDCPVSVSQETTSDLQEQLVKAQAPLQLVISTALMDSFMRVAKSNTNRSLETCGVLAGSLKNRKFFVTALIIPKQEGTSDSCNTTNEEEVFDYQDKNSLFSLGWIHTHPTQSCFMSSIDIHTQYSYQVMLPEAIAIVMAPRDTSRNHGIFRLTVPGGMSVIKSCPHSGFHPHQSPPDGGPIYKSCNDVYMDPGLKFDVADLR
ncbi:AMSH-like ubiquitin thioesterase 1 [Rhynchospora pubera]|uniref:AMSH-like ubiquitin thioesterase 1 n=1 Tax=Rhynchospora pubera TaxID=906938 RepID=A0AAV8EQC9_9POAL|nr:AMSH-like ubiquitin thioesterase 1 [Rhynchospora pubera]